MRIIELSLPLTVALDFLAWFIFHMGFTLLTLKLPDRFFRRDNWLFTTRPWEKQGRIWQSLFRIRKWKIYLPDGAALFRSGFRKKHLAAASNVYFEDFVRESRRGELTHWLVMLPAPLFFLWNPAWAGWIMIAYAVIVNIPCIIAQRYNRPRFARIRAKGGVF